MNRQRFIFAGAAAFAVACGTAAVEVQGPAGDLAQIEHGLELKVRELFGAEARVGRLFGRELVGVALEAAPEDSDVPVPLALARIQGAELEVISQTAEFKEALQLGGALALVNAEGALTLRLPGAVERTLATGVKGELSAAPNGGLLFTADDVNQGSGETAVLVAASDGALAVLADAEGIDDRGSVSPDGATVVFVSGRTGVASLFRTTLAGVAPVQLTNLGLELQSAPVNEEESAEDLAPVGFVPPPVAADALSWVSADVVRYDAGGGEFWWVDLRTGVATREGGAQ
jgi:TolB protein